MRTSATGRTNNAGFTLVEVLVVLVIVGVLAGLMVVSYGTTPARQLESETSLLATRLNAALDEAVARGSALGLVVDDAGYAFLLFSPAEQRWQPLSQRPLVPHRFALPLTVTLGPGDTAMGEQTRVRIERARGRAEADHTPQIMLFASGEATPFRLTLETADGVLAEIISDGFNGVSWSLPDA